MESIKLIKNDTLMIGINERVKAELKNLSQQRKIPMSEYIQELILAELTKKGIPLIAVKQFA